LLRQTALTKPGCPNRAPDALIAMIALIVLIPGV
jgi:hypothetical protein